MMETGVQAAAYLGNHLTAGVAAGEDADVPSSERDDRTLRTLTHVLGSGDAALALTHFVQSRVEVAITATTLAMPNGWTAVKLALNMLSRFIGAVELRVVGEMDSTLEERVAALLQSLSRIDTRAGRRVARCTEAGTVPCAAVLAIGEGVVAPCHEMTVKPVTKGESEGAAVVIALGFDAWACHLSRNVGLRGLAVTASSVPLGGMAGACFAVAEIFKTLVASAVDPAARATFERRFTQDWRYSVWTQDRATAESSVAVHAAPAPDVLPALRLERVLQVGAGAVGNATAFAFAEAVELTGVLPVLDVKVVDEKNLNRCLYFREHDVRDRKVDVLAREATRAGLQLRGIHEPYVDEHGRGALILLSTVDNNEVRHQMQETLPAYIVEGSTGDTKIAVSVHTAVDDRTCLICKHPERLQGVERRRSLSVEEAVAITGLSAAIITTGMAEGSMEITDDVVAIVRAKAPPMADRLSSARDQGMDLCGALGDLRATFGVQDGPQEASIPFVSALAGILAAAEVIKLHLRRDGIQGVPVLDNMIQMDLSRDYSRHAHVSEAYPATANCVFCQERREDVRSLYSAKHDRRLVPRPSAGGAIG